MPQELFTRVSKEKNVEERLGRKIGADFSFKLV